MQLNTHVLQLLYNIPRLITVAFITEDVPVVDVVRVYAEKDMLQTMSADHVARGAEEVFKALPTLP